MEHDNNPDERGFEPLPAIVQAWGLGLMRTQGASRETQSGVLGFGRSISDMDAISVFVAPQTNLDDKETFPDEFNGMPVTYERLQIPKDQ